MRGGADAEVAGAGAARARDVAVRLVLWLKLFQLGVFEHDFLPKIVLKCKKR
jgi:hypothetical protein